MKKSSPADGFVQMLISRSENGRKTRALKWRLWYNVTVSLKIIVVQRSRVHANHRGVFSLDPWVP
jgi:hypothetical protein